MRPIILIVPDADSVANMTIRDVIGSKLDSHSGDSLYGRIKTLSEHIHSVAMVRPDLAAPITVTTGTASAWDYGSLSADLIGAGTEADDYDVHYIIISAMSANANYQLALVAGASTVIAEVAFSRTSVQERSFELACQTPVQPAATQLRAQLASSTGAADTCDIKIYTHNY